MCRDMADDLDDVELNKKKRARLSRRRCDILKTLLRTHHHTIISSAAITDNIHHHYDVIDVIESDNTL